MKSVYEQQFEFQCKAHKLPPHVSEYKFMPERRFRFDFAWPEYMVAVEIEGGIWNGGRHTTGKGFTSDCVKYNNAAIMGWKVLRFTSKEIKSGEAINMVKSLLDGLKDKVGGTI